MKLGQKYLLFAAAMTAILLLIIGTGWTVPPGGASVQSAPVIADLNPNRITAGAPGFTLTVRGAFFVKGSVVHWNEDERATTFVDAGVVQARIWASDVALDGTAHVTVVNPIFPDEHSGISNILDFQITAASTY